MKFKFRADPKDIKKFVLFSIFLLYMSAIVVLNAHTLATEGRVYGIVPFAAFTPKYIGATLTIFGLVMLGIFGAVGSYFFDRDKGFGFTTEKKPDGYSRWCKEKEMQKLLVPIPVNAEHAEAGGLPVMNDGKTMWVDDGEAHNLIVGATGSGKTQAIVFPLAYSLAKHDESMIFTDPKGELYETMGEMLRAKGYHIILLNFRDPQKGNAWNPMTLPYQMYQEGNIDKAIELLDDLALNILYEEKSGNADPFWEKSGADYFSGLALGLFEDASEAEINLNSMNLMSTLGEERFGGPNNNYIKEYFNSKDPSKPAYIDASGTVYAPEETKGGILATFKQKVKLFSSRENLSEMLSYSDFDMKEIGRKKTAVFMIIQDEKKTLHPLATIFIKQCYETLIDVAQENGGKLPFRTNFLLDEFANMPPLKDVTTMVTAARSRKIRFNFIIQNFAQLTQVYGKENAETIKGNCNMLYLISNELAALEEISKLCGEVKSKEKDKTASRPLITVSDLIRLGENEIITIRLRNRPFKTKLVPNWKINWGKTYPKATYPEREKRTIELFDIREFVKAKKKEKMDDMMTNMGGSPAGGGNPLLGGSPFGGGMPMNPMMNAMPSFGGFNKQPSSNPFMQPAGGGLNVDDLVKKIDARIAELEEEERKEKEQADAKLKEALLDNSVAPDSMYKDNTSEDAFFDDFFSDDD